MSRLAIQGYLIYHEIAQGYNIFPTLRDKGNRTLLFCVEDPLRVGILRSNTGYPPVQTGKDLCPWGFFIPIFNFDINNVNIRYIVYIQREVFVMAEIFTCIWIDPYFAFLAILQFLSWLGFSVVCIYGIKYILTTGEKEYVKKRRIYTTIQRKNPSRRI